jgi:hypothetical protein
MDRLHRTDFLKHLSGRVFLSQDQAFSELGQDTGTKPPAMFADEARGLI